jgi:hypothetical protein
MRCVTVAHNEGAREVVGMRDDDDAEVEEEEEDEEDEDRDEEKDGTEAAPTVFFLRGCFDRILHVKGWLLPTPNPGLKDS